MNDHMKRPPYPLHHGTCMDAIHGEKYADSTKRYMDDNKKTEQQLQLIQRHRDHYHNKWFMQFGTLQGHLAQKF